jgi:hypothetical protein
VSVLTFVHILIERREIIFNVLDHAFGKLELLCGDDRTQQVENLRTDSNGERQEHDTATARAITLEHLAGRRRVSSLRSVAWRLHTAVLVWKESSRQTSGCFSNAIRVTILALADQQVIMELGLLIAASIQHCMLTVFHLQLVLELALLSTVTQLLAITVFWDHIDLSRLSNKLRIGGGVALPILFIYTSYLAYNRDQALTQQVHGRWAVFLTGAISKCLSIYTTTSSYKGETTYGEVSQPWLNGFINLLLVIETSIITPGYTIYGLMSGIYSLRQARAHRYAQTGENEWSFGQIVCLSLLLNPLIVGFQSLKRECADSKVNLLINISQLIRYLQKVEHWKSLHPG